MSSSSGVPLYTFSFAELVRLMHEHKKEAGT